jgi:phosphatidylglycerophosphatase A
MNAKPWEHYFLSGLGSGWLKPAPGTWGTLASLPLFALLFGNNGTLLMMLCATLLITLFGCWLCARSLPRLADEDPGWIVIDEWAGQWLTLSVCLSLYHSLALPFAVAWVWLASFLLFRLFDILKPYPIGPCEHIGAPWWSIMADDLLAGLMACGVFATIVITVWT